VAEALKDLGMDQEQALSIINKLDKDQNGSISFREFLKGFPPTTPRSEEKTAAQRVSCVIDFGRTST
jgi:Ca2+-binding EF-hand superfamily protein